MRRLSVLDQSLVLEGSSSAQALRDSMDLARLADELGYHRYWVAEHHGGGMVAGPSPEVLIGPIAATTSRLRVGSGGVMLPHYSPLKVAESFSVLAGLFGPRIDLAVGRAAGTDGLTAHALQRDRRAASPDDFPSQLVELLAYLDDRFPPDHPFAALARRLPGLPERPEPWLLGSSPQSALWAGQLGLPYAFADFIFSDGAPLAADYRARFEPSEHQHDPHLAVGVRVLVADTEEEALRQSASQRMAFAMLRRGRPIPIPPPEKAMRFLAAEGQDVRAAEPGRRQVVGTPDQVRAGLEEVVAAYGAQELIVLTIAHDHMVRRRSYELLAEAFELGAAADTTAATPMPS